MRKARKYAAEFMGTFALVFAGTGAIIINDVTGGAVTNMGVGLTFGMIGYDNDLCRRRCLRRAF